MKNKKYLINYKRKKQFWVEFSVEKIINQKF